MSANPALSDILKDQATPRWTVEMNTFLPVKSQFVLYGNIRDRFAFPLGEGNYDLRPMHQYLMAFLQAAGYEVFLLLDPVFGVTMLVPASYGAATKEVRDVYIKDTAAWLQKTGKQCDPAIDLEFKPQPGSLNLRALVEFPRAIEFADHVVRNKEKRTILLCDYTMGVGEQQHTIASFIRALIVSYEVDPFSADFPNFNCLLWLCDRENELPAWFSLNNPRIRSISVGTPNNKTRSLVCEALLRNAPEVAGTPQYNQLTPQEQQKVLVDFVGQTESMTLNDVRAISRFRTMGKLDIRHIADAARRYKLGITEDPWKTMIKSESEVPEFMKRIRTVLEKRVKGQGHAVEQALTIVKKSVLGLAGAQAGAGNGKPKGVLFLAGPTGTGKTELAKSLTEALFQDERAYIRFDMSEFNHEHADQRLIGAPPGYVGFEAGGELTQAIREKPCAVVLFDEIEKAHKKIMDKFLQILDDGQLTSSKGERVYFSESIIVFTSNLGMKEVSKLGEQPDYEQLKELLMRGVRHHFTEELGRPEILNRLGDNVVVFDFIRQPSAQQILEKKIEAVTSRLREIRGVELLFPTANWEDGKADPLWKFLYDHVCTDLSMGGRGIGNRVETVFEKPIADYFEQHLPQKGERLQVAVQDNRIVLQKVA